MTTRTMRGWIRSSAHGIAFGVLAFSLAASPCAAAPGQNVAPDGAELLKRILRAEERVTYDGTQVLTVWSSRRSSDTVSREYHLGPTRSRIEYVSPAEIAGRLVVNDGQARWEYNPQARVVVRSPILRQPVASAAARATLSRVLKSYSLTVSSPAQRTAGRRVYRLLIRAKQRDRESRLWWVDREKSMVLRRDVLAPDGTLRQSSHYQRVDFRPRRSPDLVRFTVPRGVRLINSANQGQSASTLAAARATAPAWAKVPASVGAGFEFDSLRLVRENGVQTVQVQYSDGLVGLSLFLSPVPTRPHSATGGARTVNIGAARGSIVQPFPPYRVLSWTVGGRTYSIVSDLSEDTLLAIARKLL